MNSLLPESWRRPVEQIQDSIARRLGHCRPRWLGHQHVENGDVWPAVLEANGGPAVEITEDSDAIRVNAELPGLERDDFSVEIEGNRLVLKGEKRAEIEGEKKGFYYSERNYGSFYREIPLPCEVDAEHISALYRRGILTVSMPKTDAAKANRIAVDAKEQRGGTVMFRHRKKTHRNPGFIKQK